MKKWLKIRWLNSKRLGIDCYKRYLWFEQVRRNIQFARVHILNNLFPREKKRKWEIDTYVCLFIFLSSDIDRAKHNNLFEKMESKIIKSALYVIARLCKLTGKIEFLRDGKERTEGILFNVMKSLDEKHARFKSVRWDELWAICMCVAMKRRWEEEEKKKWLTGCSWCLEMGLMFNRSKNSLQEFWRFCEAIISNVNLHLNICLRNYK